MERACSISCRCVVVVFVFALQAWGAELIVVQNGSLTDLALEGGEPFHNTEDEVTDAVVAEGAHGILAITSMLTIQQSARDAGAVVARV